MATFKAIVFKNHMKSDKTSNIKIRVYHNEESQYISTNHYINPKFLKNGEAIEAFPGSDELNYDIGQLIQQYRKQSIMLGSAILNNMSCKVLRDYLVKVNDPRYETIDFFSFAEKEISRTKKQKTAAWYEVSVNSYKTYIGRNSVDVRELTSSKLNGFMEYLNEKNLEPGSINNYMRGLRSLFNKCKKVYNDDDHQIIRIQHNPFSKIKIPAYRRKRKNLTLESLIMIRDFECTLKSEKVARDVFMMQFYLMGINCSDLYHLAPPYKGRIKYKRVKTDTEENLNAFTLSIKIEPELTELFTKYSKAGFLSEIKAFADPNSLNSHLNKGLKKIRNKLNLPDISTNWSRHTWASLARNKAGISKADIDFCLGHVSRDHVMADIYIEIDYSICDNANRAVLNLLKENFKE